MELEVEFVASTVTAALYHHRQLYLHVRSSAHDYIIAIHLGIL